MSVTTITEQLSRQADFELKDQARTYTRTFRAYTNNPLDDANVVAAALAAVFPLGSAYSSDTSLDLGATLTKISPQSTDHSQVWDVTLEYSSETVDPDDQIQDPLARPPVYKFSFVKDKKVLEYDEDDLALENSAKMPYDPPIEVEQSRAVFDISWNMPRSGTGAFNFDVVDSCIDCTNLDTWNGFTEGRCRITEITAEDRYEEQTVYMAVTARVELAPIGTRWDELEILDAGFYEYLGDDLDDKPVWDRIRDKYGNEVSTAYPLDGNGLKLETDDDLVYDTYRPYPTIAFVGLIPERT